MAIPFLNRHIGPNETERRKMLKALGLPSMETLIAQTLPSAIRLNRPLDIEEGISEDKALAELQAKISTAKTAISMIGQGYHNCHVPPVIQRNLLENPGWYTSYTPYQAEISQGRLEMLFHFQTLVGEITGLPTANASLLDEATAIAEAAGMAFRHHRSKRHKLAIANSLHPQNIDVLNTQCQMLDMEIVSGAPDEECAALIIQWPDTYGEIIDPKPWVEKAGRSVPWSLSPVIQWRFYCLMRRANGGQILSLVPCNDLACRWAMADHTLPIWRPRKN